MKKKEKIIMTLALIFTLSFALPFAANAMHIMEGYLPVGHVIAWSLITLPFLIAGYMSIKKTVAKDRKAITLLAMSGAFVFVLSSLNRILLTHDRYRTCSNSFRTQCSKYTRYHSAYIPSTAFSTRRLYHTWSQYFLHGYSGTFCIIYSL